MPAHILADQNSSARNRADYRPYEFKIPAINLDIDLDPKETTVKTRMTVIPKTGFQGGPMILDGEGLKLTALRVNGKDLDRQDYMVTDKHLILKKTPSKPFVLETEVKISPADNASGGGMYVDGTGTILTQLEAESARKVTFLADRPDVLSKYTATLRGDKEKYPTLLSNGNPSESVDLGGGRQAVTWTDPHAKPCYLFAVAALPVTERLEGKFTTTSGKTVDLHFYAPQQDLHEMEFAMESLKRAMAWDEKKYGREYDLDLFQILATAFFNSGAMENKGLNVFNTTLVLGSVETATDEDLIRIESVVGHEYFHNWSGDRVTCRDWFELTQKEGFTVKRDQEFTGDHHDPAINDIDNTVILRTRQFPEDAGPTSHPTRPERLEEPNNIYTMTVYEKSAAVINALHRMVGDDKWRAGTDLYFDRFDGQAATCTDFLDCIEEASGHDLTLYRRWWEQSGTPEISYTESYDPEKETYTLTLSQHTKPTVDQAEKSALHIPLAVELITPLHRKDIPLHLAGDHDDTDGKGNTTRILELDSDTKTFVFTNVTEKPVLSLNRGFTAPVKIVTQPLDTDLAFRALFDSDGFNKFDAMNALWKTMLVDMVKHRQNGGELKMDHSFTLLLEDILNNPENMGLVARQLTMPSYSEIAQELETVDPDAIVAVQDFVSAELGKHLKQTFETLYDATETPDGEKWDLSPEQTGRRALHNQALSYLATTETEDHLGLGRSFLLYMTAKIQYTMATTMTARYGALKILAKNADQQTFKKYLDLFYNDYKQHTNVVDKWLAVQVATHRPDSVEIVKDLLAHPDVDFWNPDKAPNPNKLRAVIRSFFEQNPAAFHRKDGKGYELIADVLIELSRRGNDQLAARFAVAFQQWRDYDPDRQALMQKQMQRIIAGEIGTGLKEILTKTLAMPEKQRAETPALKAAAVDMTPVV